MLLLRFKGVGRMVLRRAGNQKKTTGTDRLLFYFSRVSVFILKTETPVGGVSREQRAVWEAKFRVPASASKS